MLIDVSQMPTDQVVWLTYPILVTHLAHSIRAKQLSHQVKAYGETRKANNQRRPPELMSLTRNDNALVWYQSRRQEPRKSCDSSWIL